jgi:hypothetical protein
VQPVHALLIRDVVQPAVPPTRAAPCVSVAQRERPLRRNRSPAVTVLAYRVITRHLRESHDRPRLHLRHRHR